MNSFEGANRKIHSCQEPAIYCDCPTIGETILEWEDEIKRLESGEECAPWLSREEALEYAKSQLAMLRAQVKG